MIKGTPKTYIPKDWEISKRRFVGFLDIMGFKNLVEKKSSNEIYQMMERMVSALDKNKSGYSETEEELIISITTYSDSILIYSKDDSESCFIHFCLIVSSICDDLFREKIPHKGAVAHGEMVLDFKKSIFFGQPLIDAYLLHEQLKFYGVICHKSFENTVFGNLGDNYLSKYLCPLKSGDNMHYTIFPMSLGEHDIKLKDEIIQNVSDFKVDMPESLYYYIDNTIQYFLHPFPSEQTRCRKI